MSNISSILTHLRIKINSVKDLGEKNHNTTMSAVREQNHIIGELNKILIESIQRQTKMNVLFADKINKLISILEEQGILITLPDISKDIDKFEKGDFS